MKVQYQERILRSKFVDTRCKHCGVKAVEGEACDRCGQPVCLGFGCVCNLYSDEAQKLMSITQGWVDRVFMPKDLPMRLRSVRVLVDAGKPGYQKITEPNITIVTHCESCYSVGYLEPYNGQHRCPACGNARPSEKQIAQ